MIALVVLLAFADDPQPEGGPLAVPVSVEVTAQVEAAAPSAPPSLGVGDSGWCRVVNERLACGDGEGKPITPWIDGPVVEVDLAAGHACVRRPDGTLACRDRQLSGPVSVVPVGRFTTVSTGEQSACALGRDQRAQCWGRLHGASVPADRFTAISVAASHACGLLADGTAQCFGRMRRLADQRSPAGLVFTRLATAEAFTCGLTPDARWVCWGDLIDGLWTADGRYTHLDAAGFGACAVKIGGDVVCWSPDASDDWYEQYPLPSLHAPAEALAIGPNGDTGCAVPLGGEPVCWGAWP